MKRTIMIGMAIAVLVGAAVAYAASLNSYSAAMSASPTKAGSKKKPVPIAMKQTLTAKNATAGSRAAPLIRIKTTIYGLIANTKPFPTCSNTMIATGPKFNDNCPTKSHVASGQVNALLGGTDLTMAGAPCNPGLEVYNGGHNKLWFFFTAASALQCGGLKTGATAPYPGTISQKGKNLIIDVPLPPDVSTAVAGQTGFYGSLIKEVVNYKKVTTKVKGKTVGFFSSVACKGKKRPWSVAFTATDVSGAKETKTVSGEMKCTK